MSRVRIRDSLFLAFLLFYLLSLLVVAVKAQGLRGEGGFVRGEGGYAEALPPMPWRENVFATEEIKAALGKHQILLIPAPPKPPAYAAKGTQYDDLTPEKDFNHDAANNGQPDWCLGPNEPHRWTSEKGSVMLNGHPLFLKGINWYGFEGDLFVPHGLAVWSPEYFMNFLATHHFNAVRIPFSLEWALRGLDAPLVNQWVVQPDMRGYTQGQLLDRIFDAAAKHGVVILLDLHVITDKAGIQDLWYDKTANNDKILDTWTQVLKYVAGRWNLLGIDIKNEPHGIATWGKGNPKTDWNVFAQHAIATLANRVPEFQGVFFVEGVEKSPDQKYACWWGGNFDGLRWAPIRTGREDLDKRVVYSPHIYGPEVFPHHLYFRDPAFPDNMPAIWDSQYSWIERETGRAVVLGEWGGSIVGDPKASANQQALAKWLVHACIPDNFWWCLNPATKFNGGLLGENYQIVDENVLRILHFVQPKPTKFHHQDDGSLCVIDGAFANARCALRSGGTIQGAQSALKAEREIQP